MGSKWRWQALREGPGWLQVQESDRILQSQTRLASPEKGISGRQCENPLRIWPYLRKSHAWLLFFPLPPLLCSSLGKVSLSKSTLKVAKLLLESISSLSVPQPHTHKEDLIRWKRVFGCHCHRRDQRSIWEFFYPFLQISLPSWWGLMKTAAGGASANAQLSTSHNLFQVTVQALVHPHSEHNPYPESRSQRSGMGGSRVLMLNARCTLAP